jgi:predicted acetyltransferase
MTDVRLVDASVTDKPVVRNLLELYQHDLSGFDNREVDSHGFYGYPYLDHYWTDTARHPFLLQIDGYWAGLVLVRLGSPIDMAEFFVMRKYRHRGVGRTAASAVFARLPGSWQIRQLSANQAATAFWRAVIPVPFTEEETENGPVQRFVIPDT